jgi:hypothetical protein
MSIVPKLPRKQSTDCLKSKWLLGSANWQNSYREDFKNCFWSDFVHYVTPALAPASQNMDKV